MAKLFTDRVQGKRRRVRIKYSTSAVIGIVTAAGILFGIISLIDRYSRGVDRVAAFALGHGRQIVFAVDRSWEVSRTLYYEVIVDGRVMVPRTSVMTVDEKQLLGLQFSIVTVNDGNMVGIVNTDRPEDFLVVHDFSTNSSWPWGGHIEWNSQASSEANLRRRREDRAALERALRRGGAVEG